MQKFTAREQKILRTVLNIPAGYTIQNAIEAAKFILEHRPGDEVPLNVESFVDAQDQDARHKTNGDWAKDVMLLTGY